jgi:hypothetical protein
MPAFAASTGVGKPNYASMSNNTASWWFKDAGMRMLAISIAVGFCSTINSGKP